MIPGQTIAHYRLLQELGSGGMGVVYKAEDLRLKRHVALKFLPAHLTQDAHAKERFVHEARAASALDHPNICTIHEVAETEDGQLFIAMACYGGETLRQRIEHGPLGFEEACAITRQVASGLAKAHGKGIVHRDLNPSNIMITEDGVVKVLDFGLAKLAGQTRTTRTGTTVGTIPYMSPEQLTGGESDARADIWSLGVVVYQMLSGKLPFRGDHAPAMMYAITNEEPQSLAQVRSGVPLEMTVLVERCLEKDPDRRLQSMDEVLRVLGSVRVAESLRRPRLRGRRWKPYLVVGLPVLMVTGGLLWAILRHSPERVADVPARVRIGILAFQSQAGDTAAARWPFLIQSMLVAQLTGLERVGVVPPNTLKSIMEKQQGTAPTGPTPYRVFREQADVTFILDGGIVRADGGYRVLMNVVDAAEGYVHYSTQVEARRDAELQEAVLTLADRVLAFLEIGELPVSSDEALQKWSRPRARNIEAEAAFLEASNHLYRGESGAAKLLQRALELDSTFISPRVWIISGLMAFGMREEANRHYRILLSLRANPFESAMIRWCGAAIRGDPAEQIRALSTALQYSPRNNILLLNLAEAYDKAGDYQAALDAILPAVNVRWRFAPVYSDAARYSAKLGRYDEARSLLDDALSMTPVHPETYSMLAALACRKGDAREAERYTALAIKRFEEVDGRTELLYWTLGNDLLAVDEYSLAADRFRKASELSPSVPRYQSGLADALFGAGKIDEASHAFRSALQIDSTWSHAHLMLAAIAEEKGERSAAVGHYQSYLTLQPAGRIADTVRQHLNNIRQ
jgi:tetratricopeptide (TPR) repeat protein